MVLTFSTPIGDESTAVVVTQKRRKGSEANIRRGPSQLGSIPKHYDLVAVLPNLGSIVSECYGDLSLLQ